MYHPWLMHLCTLRQAAGRCNPHATAVSLCDHKNCASSYLICRNSGSHFDTSCGAMYDNKQRTNSACALQLHLSPKNDGKIYVGRPTIGGKNQEFPTSLCSQPRDGSIELLYFPDSQCYRAPTLLSCCLVIDHDSFIHSFRGQQSWWLMAKNG